MPPLMEMSLEIGHLIAILLAGFAGGAINAVAGGGTNLTFPMLLWIGIPPVEANVTSAVALWPGGITGAWGYRAKLAEIRRAWFWLAVPSFVGGLLGAWLLVHTPQTIFRSVAPFLILASSILIAAQPWVKRFLDIDAEGSRAAFTSALLIQLLIALYGGYFGSGIGLMMLVTLGLTGIHNIHHANALKNVLGVLLKGVAVGYFIIAGSVVWIAALIMAAGALLGGYAGARMAQRIPERPMRWAIATFGIVVAVLMIM